MKRKKHLKKQYALLDKLKRAKYIGLPSKGMKDPTRGKMSTTHAQEFVCNSEAHSFNSFDGDSMIQNNRIDCRFSTPENYKKKKRKEKKKEKKKKKKTSSFKHVA